MNCFRYGFHKLSVTLALVAVSTGCAHYHPQPLSAEKSAAALESRSLTNVALKAFLEKNLHRDLTDWPAMKWDFDSLMLAAFYYHPDMAVARAQWQVAEAGIKTAGGRPNPTLSLVPGYDTTHHAGLSPWFPAVSFDLPLETMGKRGKRIAAAEKASESARLGVATATWQVRNNLRTALLDFFAAQRRAQLLEKQVPVQEEIVKLIEQQVQAGALAGSEAVTFRIGLQKVRLDLADAESQRVEARTHLAESVGVPTTALDGIEISSDGSIDPVTLADLTTAEARHTALISRSDILAALADYAVTEANLRLERT